MKYLSLPVLAAALLLASARVSPALADEAPRGMTMHIHQEQLIGADTAIADYHASFLPPDRFRIQGMKHLKSMHSEVNETIAGNGQLVRQIEKVGDTTKAFVVDLDRIRKELPWADYSPSKTYDPSVYRDMIKNWKEKTSLPAEQLDGAQADGYELALPQGRLSLPFNVSISFPNPVKARIWLNPKDEIARKVELEDSQGRVFLKTLYTDVKTGVQVDPAVFELELPEGVSVMDLTNIVMRGVETTRHPPEQPGESKPAE